MQNELINEILNFQYATYREEDVKIDMKKEGLNCADESGVGNIVVACAGEEKGDGIGWQKVIIIIIRFNDFSYN